MDAFLHGNTFHRLVEILIAAVWFFHGLYSKIPNGIPRHKQIVGKILGSANVEFATRTIGVLEVLLGIWVLVGWQPVICAAVQTAAIVTMNVLEISFAIELLISACGMAVLNLGFLSLVWYWACFAPKY
jgi:uncharacterized membrane protein YphA (DoxX/SURF4 family)